jgi:hypothetical protein
MSDISKYTDKIYHTQPLPKELESEFSADIIAKFHLFVHTLGNKPLCQIKPHESELWLHYIKGMISPAIEMFLAMEKEREKAEKKAQEDFRRKVACEHAEERITFWRGFKKYNWNPLGFCKQPLAEGLSQDWMSNSGWKYDYSDPEVTDIYRMVAKVAEPNPLQELFRLAYDLQAEIPEAKGLSRELFDLHIANVPTD